MYPLESTDNANLGRNIHADKRPERLPLCFPEWENVRHDASCQIRIDDPDYPGYCRPVWTEHVAEMSDLRQLSSGMRFNILMAVEVGSGVFGPDKVNLASLATQYPICTGTSSRATLTTATFLSARVGSTQRKEEAHPHPRWMMPVLLWPYAMPLLSTFSG